MNYQHSPYPKPDAYHALQMPLYQNSAFEFQTAEEMEAAFTGKNTEHCYSRITNPTVQYLEERVRTITGAYSVTALNSGMAAICNTIVTLAKSGSNIVTSYHLFGNTYSLFKSTLAEFGLEVRFCDLTNENEVKENIDENTCALFLEVITNPQMEVADLKTLSKIAGEAGIPLVADTTIVPFCAWKAGAFGINIEVVSSTKYISGGTPSLGGLIIDYGTFNWSCSQKLKTLAYDFPQAFTHKLRKEIHRNLGAYMTPTTAYQQTLGLETLPLRFERAASTCLKVAETLESLKNIQAVQYNGLKANSFYEISLQQFGPLPGAMLTFDLQSRTQCFAFLNGLKTIRRATNLFDNKTLIIHPASTIYGNFSEDEQRKMDIRQETLRLSVGLEDAEVILDDIRYSLNQSR